MLAYELNKIPKRSNGPILCDIQGHLFVRIPPVKKTEEGEVLPSDKGDISRIYVYNPHNRYGKKGVTEFFYREYLEDGSLSEEVNEISFVKLMDWLEIDFDNSKIKRIS